MSKKSPKKRTAQEPRAYLAKIKYGYLAVVEGQGEKEITTRHTIKKIADLLETRRKAGEELSKIIHDTGITTASIHRAAVVLGEGD